MNDHIDHRRCLLRQLGGVIQRHQLVLIMILLLGLALRVWRLAAQDIWWDEASSAFQAPMSLYDITLYQARDQHPPLYYWQLHYYYRLAGSSLFALRFLSVLWGELGILIAYLLGKRLFRSTRIGLLGALLLAISRFHIAWSQEIKMYAMLSTMAMASLLLMWYILEDQGWMLGAKRPIRLLSHRSRGWLYIGYAVVTILSIYCHYIALLGVAGQNLYVLVAARFRRGRQDPWLPFLIRWGLGQALVLAVAVPWFLLHAEHSTTWVPSEPTPPVQAIQMVATLLSQGISAYVERYTWQTIALWLPVLAAPVLALRLRDRAGLALLWLALLSTALLAYVLTLPVLNLGYEAKLAARFFIIAVTPYCLLLAHAIERMRQRKSWLAYCVLFGVIVLQLSSLGPYYRERYPEDSYETLSSTIESLAQEGDAILLMNDSEWPVFRYYYEGDLVSYSVPYGAPGGDALIEPYVAPILADHDGIWLVLNVDARRQDGHQEVLSWLSSHAEVVLNEAYGQRRLVLLRKKIAELCANVPSGHVPEHVTDLEFEQGLRLVGVDQALHEARAGQRLSLVSYWVMDLGSRYQIHAELVHPRTNERVASSVSSTMGAGSEGCTKRVRLDIPISRSIPRGLYRVELVVPTMDGALTRVTANHVFIRSSMQQVSSKALQPLEYDLGPTIGLRGFAQSDTTIEPGQALRFNISYACLGEMETSYVAFVHLLGQAYNVDQGNSLWGQSDVVPMAGTYPTDVWSQGDIIEDEIEVVLAANAPSGDYAIEFGMYDPLSGQRLSVVDGAGQPVGDHIILGQVAVESSTSWLRRQLRMGGPTP